MSRNLRVLNVEDSEQDVALLVRHLTLAGYEVISDRVDTPAAMRAALETREWDVILCDYSMPQFDALGALALMKEIKLDISFIIISGTIGEAAAVEAMRAGAHDYLMKDSLARLVPAIEREMNEAENRRARRQAEEQLRLQTAALQAAANAILITDRAGKIIWVNPAFTQHTGYSFEEVRGKNPRLLKSGKQDRAFYREMWETILSGKVWRNTVINRRKDGALNQEDLTITPIRDNTGEITHFVAIKQDINKAGALQSAIFNSANFSSIATDAKGVIQIFNVGAERMLGYEAAEVVNKITPAEISDPQEVIARAKALSVELATTITPGFEALVFKASRGIEDIYELTYIRKDGSRFPAIVSVTALRDDEEGIIGYLLIGTDNTARKQVEAEQKKLDQRLRDQQFYTRSLIESNIDAIMTTDPSGIITDVNKQMEALTGYTRDELIGAPFKNYFTDPERAEAGIKLVLNEKKVTDYELTVRARDGKKTVVSYNATTFYDRDRTLQGVFAAARDVTERKRFERALQESNVELEGAKSAAETKTHELASMTQQLWQASKLATMGELAASVAHELNNPLATISLHAEVLVGQLAADDPNRRSLLVIEQEVERMATLVSNLLLFSRRSHRQLSTIDIGEELQNSLEFINYHLRSHGINVATDFADDLPSVQADRQQLRQVFLNLLTNASDAMPEGGTLTVRAKQQALESGAPAVVIEFSDTGIGIEPEDLPKLWESFFTTKPEGKGTGLGLPICRRTVEEHRGTIDIEKPAGERHNGADYFAGDENGSHQSVSNQVEQLEMKPAAKGSALSSSPVGKIIVVDDEPELKNILVEALSAQGFEVTGCGSGQQALEELRQKEFDLLLTDLMMPEMDGIALLEAAVKIDPHLIGIMMTGQGTIQTAVDAMKVGAFDYVLKPFRLQTVMPVLTRAINTRRLRMENLQLRETVAIYSLCQTIAFTLDAQTVLSRLADAALQQSDADEVSILLPTSDGKELFVAAVRGEKRERLLGERVPLQESISSWVARERTPLILNGEVHDERFVALWPRPEIRSAVSVPMQVANKLVGIINLNVTNRLRPFTLGQMKALTILASTAAAALESASLYTQVQHAEKNYRSIFENAVEGIFQSTPDRRPLTVNPAMAHILGYESPEEVVNSFTDIGKQLFVDQALPAEVTRTLEERGVLQGFEFEAYRKDGAKIWLSLNIRVVRDEKGTEVCREGTIEDITERKRAEAERLVMFEIIQGSITTRNLDEFLKLIQKSIGKLLYAVNCFVGLYDETTSLMHFEYWADQFDAVPLPHPPGKGFSSYVLRTNKPLLLTEEIKSRMYGSGEVEKSGRSSASWLGVPLRMSSRVIGVLVVQHYEDKHAYSQRDLELLSSVGDQIALAIERKQAEKALRESEERYRDLVENAHDLIYEHDLEGNYISANKAVEQITGYSLEESFHLNLAQVVAPDYLEKSLELFHRKLAGERVTAYEMEIIAKDGHRVAVEVNSSLVLRDGVPVGVRGIARDITERKRAEADLVRLAAVVEQTACSVVITDPKGNIQYVNPAFERITGYAKEEVLDQSSRILKSGKTDQAVYKELWETITRGEVWVGQLTNRKKDGTLFEERVTISPVRDKTDRIVNYIAVKQDISDFIELEEQLRQSQKMEAIGQLAGGVAHDFNNLLTAINGYSALARRRIGEDHPISSYLEEISKAGDRAASLTRQLLAFGRKQLLQPLALNLNEIVGDMIKLLKRLIGEDVQLVTRPGADLKQIKADPGQLEQVLVNLVVNARDAMPRGGTVTIETANTKLDGPYASSHVGVTPGEYVMLAISDTGTGMDHETQSRIFEPFFTTKEKGKGTGLGLSTVYGIVKQSGGNVWVYSEIGKGTTFKVYLPQIENEVKASEDSQAHVTIKRGSETVLLVEDEEMVRHLASELLEESGYVVLSAGGGEEAISFATTHKDHIDLLITDVVMPKISGKEVAEQLKKIHPETKVLFMSGYTDEAIVHHGIVDSNIAFIQKPFSEHALAHKIREVLDSENGHK